MLKWLMKKRKEIRQFPFDLEYKRILRQYQKSPNNIAATYFDLAYHLLEKLKLPPEKLKRAKKIQNYNIYLMKTIAEAYNQGYLKQKTIRKIVENAIKDIDSNFLIYEARDTKRIATIEIIDNMLDDRERLMETLYNLKKIDSDTRLKELDHIKITLESAIKVHSYPLSLLIGKKKYDSFIRQLIQALKAMKAIERRKKKNKNDYIDNWLIVFRQNNSSFKLFFQKYIRRIHVVCCAQKNFGRKTY